MVLLPAGDWITVKEAADVLGVSVRRVQVFIALHRLKATRMSDRLFLLLRSDVLEFKRTPRPVGRKPKSRKGKK